MFTDGTDIYGGRLRLYPYKNLTYKIIGILYDVYNKLGYGYQEKYYQRAIEAELKRNRLSFKRELSTKLKYDENIIGRYYLDFLIDNKVILEIKIANDFYQKDLNQILAYMKHLNKRIGLLAIITKKGVKIKRLIN